MNKIQYISFDYSLSSPAMTVSDGETFKCFAFSSDKKITHKFNDENLFDIEIKMYPSWGGKDQQNRYFQLAQGFVGILESFKRDGLISSFEEVNFAIEDYSFGSKGKVFHIAENTQMIKYMIWSLSKKEMIQLPPTSIKKLFSGKGTANKELMADSFHSKYGYYLHEKLGCKIEGTSCDIIDSIAINIILRDICTQKISLDDIFVNKSKKTFSELKPLPKFKGLAKIKS
jgi:hypothetical protein